MRLFVDNLTNIDFSYLHSTRGLLGETWRVNIELHGELDDQSMVLDFGKVKKQIKQWLDTYVDHCLVVPKNSSCLTVNDSDTQREIIWQYNASQLKCTAPLQAITLVDGEEIESDNLARWCETKLSEIFPSSVKKVIVNFVAEDIKGPFYHYSHGLKKHDGNCQRIAHGHRSKILIWRDDALSLKDMEDWAQKFEDIYIATQEDSTTCDTPNYNAFRYCSEQGEFYIELPVKNTYLIESDSTVECIAQHIADTLKNENPSHNFCVKAFEGIDKGAIATS